MKRLFAGFLGIVAMLFCTAGAEISAKGAILIDFASGRVLYEKNADQRLALASTTKIMTCLLALENAGLDEKVTAGKNASGVPGTSIYLSVGETLTMEEMLYALMLRSGNDAAVAIAEHVAGDVESFAELMNARASELGADAYFTTPNGLDKGENGASARALTLIAREAMKNETFRKIVSTRQKNIPWVDHDYMRVLTNKNKLLASYEGALGIKTGFTTRAGRCLAFAAERNGLTVVGAVLNAPNWFEDARQLMDAAFEEYHVETLLSGGFASVAVPVEGAGRTTVELWAEKALSVPLKAGEMARVEWEILPLQAPVKAGDICGWAYAVIGEEKLAETALLAGADVEKRSFQLAVRKVVGMWPSMSEP